MWAFQHNQLMVTTSSHASGAHIFFSLFLDTYAVRSEQWTCFVYFSVSNPPMTHEEIPATRLDEINTVSVWQET